MTITDIKTQKSRKGRVSIYVDGKYAFSLDLDTLGRSDLHINDSIDEKQIDKLIKKDEFARARDYGYTLISYRDRSEYEFKRRLFDKGFHREIVNEVFDIFKDDKLVDDRSFAYKWVDNILNNKPMGRMRVIHELREKRVDDKIIEEVCNKKLELKKESELARKACGKRMNVLKNYPLGVVKRRLFQHLKNRGFDFEIIQELMKEYFSDDVS